MSIFLKAGDIFSGCEILGQCGKGSFGIAYLAKNPIGQKIVIKVVSSPRGLERELKGLRNYMQVSGKHPNLLRIFHIGEVPEGFYYIMEAADDCGENGIYRPATLGNLFRSRKRFTPEEAIAVTRDLLAGVQVMHQANLIHRDIKPDNIIFVNGRAKLSDPGLVIEAGQSASFAGTLGFLPPEALNGECNDQRGDLYAIGKVFYCMVTGFQPKQYPELPLDMRLEVCRQIYPALSRMCNRNPARRFRSAGEFLAGLPVRLEKPTRWEIWRGNFRDWRILNRELCRWIMFGFWLVLGILLCGIAAWMVFEQHKKVEIAACRKLVADFLQVNQDRRDLVGFQIQVFLPDMLPEYERLAAGLKNARESEDWKTAADYSGKLRLHLKNAAEKLIPELPAGTEDFQKNFAAAGAMHGFLSAPLSEYLDSETLDRLKQALKAYEKRLYRNWSGPRCGQEWNNFQNDALSMVFVPPGAVRMRHSKKIVKIPGHFWICKNEVPHEHFTQLLGIAPQKTQHSHTPAERVSWNDVLFYCSMLTRQWRNAGLLPPGCIVRPPGEQEWEYAAANAWLGADTVPFADRAVFRGNSKQRTWPAGTRKPSRLGIYDLYGNVAEMVLPFQKPKHQNAVMVRGGSFLSTENQCFRQMESPAFQNSSHDIGFRVVVAPGTEDYFDRHFFLGGPQQARIRGKVYELIGTDRGAFDWASADRISRLLGGRLAEIPDARELNRIKSKIPLTGSFPTLLGGRQINGEWKWVSLDRKIDFGHWKNPRTGNPGTRLALSGKSWVPVDRGSRFPLFLCEWDEKNYDRRNESLKSEGKLPGERYRFSYRDRTFLLIESGMPWPAAYRVCELLGGRLACPDTPELEALLKTELQSFRNYRIFLGGYAKRDKWYWISGKEAVLPLEPDEDFSISSRNRNYIVLRNGKFYNSQHAQMFLCEWRASSASSH